MIDSAAKIDVIWNGEVQDVGEFGTFVSGLTKVFEICLKFVQGKMKFLISTTYYKLLCWDVVIEGCCSLGIARQGGDRWGSYPYQRVTSGSYLSCVCMVPSSGLCSLGVVCQAVTYVREFTFIKLCPHG